MATVRLTKIGSVLCALLLAAASLSSCRDGDLEIHTDASGVDKDVVFRIAVPYAANNGDPQTRAIGDAQENTITSLFVLAFDNNEQFDYSAIGVAAPGNTPGSPTQNFTVTVKVKPYPQRFVIIANANAETAALLGGSNWKGAPKETMLANLKITLTPGNKWNAISASNYTAFPMWGQSAQETITRTTTGLTGEIPLMRMIAKINVQLDTSVSGLTGKFKIKDVRLYNTHTAGRVTPAPASVKSKLVNGKTYLYVDAPSVPAGATLYEGPLTYNDFTAPGVTDVAMRGAIYTLETAAPADAGKATCLVVGGLYGADQDMTYYRVDFLEDDGTTFRAILRNHLYVVNVVDVLARGHSTPEIAYTSKSVNMKVEILKWNETGLTGVAFDGQHMLSVSREEFSFSKDPQAGEGANNVLYVFTDHPSGWEVEKIVNESDGTTATWLTATPNSDAADKNKKTKVVLTYTEAPAKRVAIIWFKAGRLRYPVRVEQSVYPDIALRLLDFQSKDITEMIFGASTGNAPAQQTLTVNWKPASAGLTVANTYTGNEVFPVASSGAPVAGTVPAGGAKTYTIAPPAIQENELLVNKFLEKTSLVTFTVSNGAATENKSVMLRQINYNLLSNAVYPLSSKRDEAIPIYSNFDWEVVGVKTDPYNIVSAVKSATGKSSTGTGSPLTVTLSPESLVDAGQATVEGTATITLKNPIDNVIWDVPVTIVESLYVGRFGGQLQKDANGVWQFERRLYIQSSDESTGIVWSEDDSATQGVTDERNGKANTWTLHANGYDNPAASLCVDKNGTVQNANDPNYRWYLPSVGQMLAATMSQKVLGAYRLDEGNPYWASTEVEDWAAWGVFFIDSSTWKDEYKGSWFRVRCVREMPW